MLSEKILALAQKKYEKIHEIYSKSLEVTLKIFSVLKKGDFQDAPALFEERDALLLASQNSLSELDGLFKQLFIQERVSTGRPEDLPAAFSAAVAEINKLKDDMKRIIGKIVEADGSINSILASEAGEIKNRIRALKTTRSVNGKYKPVDFNRSNFKLSV